MKKVMNYIDGRIDHSNRLRYILVHIIECIPELKQLDIQFQIQQDMEFSSWFEFKAKGDEFKCGIELSNGDILEDENNYMELTLLVKNLYEYFRLNNIQEYDLFIAKWIFITLHELGHIHSFYINRYIYDKFRKVNEVHKMGLKRLIDKSDPISSMHAYFSSAGELEADKFAYRYFPYIWNILKQRGLI